MFDNIGFLPRRNRAGHFCLGTMKVREAMSYIMRQTSVATLVVFVSPMFAAGTYFGPLFCKRSKIGAQCTAGAKILLREILSIIANL